MVIYHLMCSSDINILAVTNSFLNGHKPSQLPKANKIRDHKNKHTTATLVNQHHCVCHMYVCLLPYSNTCVSACAHKQTHTERQREGEGRGREDKELIHYLGNDFPQMTLTLKF